MLLIWGLGKKRWKTESKLLAKVRKMVRNYTGGREYGELCYGVAKQLAKSQTGSRGR